MMIELLGMIFGGVFRLVPEAFKIWDAKDARKHELAMMDVEVRLATMRAEQAMHVVNAEVSKAELGALQTALAGQERMATAGGKLVAAISALVRPLITYWLVVLWSAVKISMMLVAYQQSASWSAVLIGSWTHEDQALMMGVISFWFTGRAWESARAR